MKLYLEEKKLVAHNGTLSHLQRTFKSDQVTSNASCCCVFFFAIIASFLCVQRTAIHTYNWIECSESGLTSIESLMVAPIGQASIL